MLKFAWAVNLQLEIVDCILIKAKTGTAYNGCLGLSSELSCADLFLAAAVCFRFYSSGSLSELISL